MHRLADLFRDAPGRVHPFLIAALVGLAGCQGDYRPQAVGDTGTLLVVMDDALWEGAPGEAVRDVFEAPIRTLPSFEPSFSVRQTDIESMEQFESVIQRRKFLLFAGILNDSTNVSRFLTSRLDSTIQATIRRGEEGVFQLEDLWYRDQIVFYVAASTPEELAETIRSSGQTIAYNLNEVNRETTETEMFETLRQVDIEQQLMEEHGFAVNVQHDYLVAIDTTNFVWLRRFVDESNWRSLSVWYVDNADPTMLSPEWIYEARNRLTQTYMEGNMGGFPEIDTRRPLTTEAIDFLGRFGYETRGLWHMVSYDAEGNQVRYGGGGPFLTYTFFDEEQGRLYMIDGFIFAPKYDKRELLRQIEAIAHTFRTQPDAEAADPAPEAAPEAVSLLDAPTDR